MEEVPLLVADEHEQEDQRKKRYWVPLEHSLNGSSLPVPGWLWHVLFLFLIAAFAAITLMTVHVRNHPPSALFQKRYSKRKARAVEKATPVESSAVKIIKDQSEKQSKGSGMSAGGSAQADVKATPIPKTSKELAEKKVTAVKNIAEADRSQYQKSISVLEKIRQDPGRIYLDNQFTVGDLTFALRNLSPQYGMELYVRNSEDTAKTYYFPKAKIEKQDAIFEGTVLAPGGSLYGYAIIPDLRSGMTVSIQFSAVGAGTRKETVKLKW